MRFMTDDRRMDAQRHGRPANAFPKRNSHHSSDILLIGLIPPMIRGKAVKQMLRKRYQSVLGYRQLNFSVSISSRCWERAEI